MTMLGPNVEHDLSKKHLAVIDAIAPAPISNDGAQLEETSRLVALGNSDFTNTTTVSEHEAITAARYGFAEKMGLTDPSHDLNHAYKRVVKAVPAGLKPGLFLDAMAVLADSSGSIETATHLVQKAPYLLRHRAKSIRLRYAYMHRLTAVLGWDGDVNKFIHDRPKALMHGHNKVRFLGRLAARFADPEEHKTLSHAQLNTLLNKPSELHLIGLLKKGEAYTLGQGAAPDMTTSSDQQEYIYKNLASRRVAERIGYKVLKAYLRQDPPSEAALKKYPHLAFLQRGQPARKEKVELPEETPRAITGSEVWLGQASIPVNPQGRKTWLTKINNYIEVGSRSIAGRRPGGEAYEEVLNARIMFFRLLGWTSPQTKIGKAYIEFADKYQQLIRADRIVGTLKLLADRGIPMDEDFLANLFHAYRISTERIAKRIDKIEALHPDDALNFIHRRPTVLFVGDTVLARTLRQSVNVKSGGPGS